MNAEDVATLQEIASLLSRRNRQYDCALVQGIYAVEKADDGPNWKNWITKITALPKGSEKPVQSLYYGQIIYIERSVSLDIFENMIKEVVYSGSFRIDNHIISLWTQDNLTQGVSIFQSKMFQSTSYQYIPLDWPANLYQCASSANLRASVSNERLIAVDKPLYPDVRHLVLHKIGIDLQRANAWVGSVLLLLPNYQGKISEIKIGTKGVSLSVTLGTAKLDDLVAKVYASNGQNVFHCDTQFNETQAKIDIGFYPNELEVCLLNVHDSELLDLRQLFSKDIATATLLEESDPQFVRFLAQQGEGLQLEYKPGKLESKDFEELAETAVAFANRIGGRILVGVSNKGAILGCDETGAADKILNSLTNRIEPPIEPRIQKVTIEDKIIYVIRVPEGSNKPYILKDRGALIRRGASDFPITRTELDEIYEAKREPMPGWPRGYLSY